MLNDVIRKRLFDFVHDEKKVKERLFTCKLPVNRGYRGRVKGMEELCLL
ncbi:hypothetical protein BOVA711_1580 [Bacteroides ovatus]|nr:hypothetical protein BOVA711_1580 [Bacteroides ovatus]CAG9904611.1 hypothetical protein BOVA172_267 [Bacteroides ovatus]CAG9918213.1 hypothetical protein BOVA435_2699 [Bacteroides ovatus]CAG9925055.1 hypothetical protein BOVAC16_4057 [Bacteroides ovatus]